MSGVETVDDDTLSLGSTISDVESVFEDPTVNLFHLGPEHCRKQHDVKNHTYICHRLLSKCSCEHSSHPESSRHQVGVYRIHRSGKGVFKGVHLHPRIKGRELQDFFDHQRSENRESAQEVAAIQGLGTGTPARVTRSRVAAAASKKPPPVSTPPSTGTPRISGYTGSRQEEDTPITRGGPSPGHTWESGLRRMQDMFETLSNEMTSLQALGATLQTQRDIPKPRTPQQSPPGEPLEVEYLRTERNRQDTPAPPHGRGKPIPLDPTRPTWYAIQKGKHPSDRGVYHLWSEVGPRVLGVSGARYKSFGSLQEAEAYAYQDLQAPQGPTTIPQQGRRVYAILQGREPQDQGVYFSWDEVEPRVIGVPGAIYQSFPNQEMAYEFLSRGNQPPPLPFQATGPLNPGPGWGGNSIPDPSWGRSPQTRWGNPSQGGVTPHYSIPQGGTQGWSPHPAPMGPPRPPQGTGGGRSLFLMPDRSAGRDHELFGYDARNHVALMDAFTPPGPPTLDPTAKSRLANQVLDAVGLPGTSSPSADESHISRLAEGIQTLATGGLTDDTQGLSGLMDTGWTAIRRNTLGTIRNQDDLQQRIETLHRQRDEILSQVVSRIQMVLMGAGYDNDYSYSLATESMYYRISKENLEAYLNLHITLLTQSATYGFDVIKEMITYHSNKLREPRGIYSVRLQMIAHHYIYFRDGMRKGWQSFGIHNLQLRLLRNQLAGSSGNNHQGNRDRDGNGKGARLCPHCKSGLHAGGKKQCPWSHLKADEAQKAAVEAAQKFGSPPPKEGQGKKD